MAGTTTLGIPTIINANGGDADVLYIAAETDISSSGRKGADNAPRAIREALDTQIELDELLTGIRAVDRLKFGWRGFTGQERHSAGIKGVRGDLNDMPTTEGLKRALNLVERAVFAAFEANQFPLMLGGDHSNTIGALRALRRRVRNPSKTAIVVVDAHHDLREDDSDFRTHPFGPLAHCCALREAVEAGFRVVQVGVRAYSREEKEFAAKHGVNVFYWLPEDLDGFIHDGWIPPSVISVLGQIGAVDNVYLTVDVDGFDPSVMPATGTPFAGGLTWEYGLRLIAGVCRHFNLIGADICEVAVSDFVQLTDLPEAEYRTVINAAQLAYSIPTWARAMKKI